MENQKEQLTPVEWFATNYNYGMSLDEINDLLKKTKEREKDLMIKFGIGYLDWVSNEDPNRFDSAEDYIEQYYEQTYGGNK